jgi:hypothetical protein
MTSGTYPSYCGKLGPTQLAQAAAAPPSSGTGTCPTGTSATLPGANGNAFTQSFRSGPAAEPYLIEAKTTGGTFDGTVVPANGYIPCAGGTVTLNSGGYTNGVYNVPSGCEITLDFTTGNFPCLDLILHGDDQVGLNGNNGTTGTWTSYASAGCGPGGTTVDNYGNRNVVWESPTAAQPPTKGFCADSDPKIIYGTPCNEAKGTFTIAGAVYVPNHTIDIATNAFISVDGQAICGEWEVQSGNTGSPSIIYDPGKTSAEPDILRLAE